MGTWERGLACTSTNQGAKKMSNPLNDMYKALKRTSDARNTAAAAVAGGLVGGLYGDGVLLGKPKKPKGMSDAKYKRLIRKARITGAVRGASTVGNLALLGNQVSSELLREGAGANLKKNIIGGGANLANILAGASRVKDDDYLNLIHGKRFKRQANSFFHGARTKEDAKRMYRQNILTGDLGEAFFTSSARFGLGDSVKQTTPGLLDALRDLHNTAKNFKTPDVLKDVFGDNAYEAVKNMKKADFKKLYRKAAFKAHPDRGGSVKDMEFVNKLRAVYENLNGSIN